EADERFVVVSGSAPVEAQGGAPLRVGPGDLAAPREGARTTGTGHGALRRGAARALPGRSRRARRAGRAGRGAPARRPRAGTRRRSPAPAGCAGRSRRRRAARRPAAWLVLSTVVSHRWRSREMPVLS